MSGYLGDLSSIQEKSLEELKKMLTAETTTDEVSREIAKYCPIAVVLTKTSTIYDRLQLYICASLLRKTSLARSVNCRVLFITDSKHPMASVC